MPATTSGEHDRRRRHAQRQQREHDEVRERPVEQIRDELARRRRFARAVEGGRIAFDEREREPGPSATAPSSASSCSTAFREAIAFVNRLADLAESENHHPDIAISLQAASPSAGRRTPPAASPTATASWPPAPTSWSELTRAAPGAASAPTGARCAEQLPRGVDLAPHVPEQESAGAPVGILVADDALAVRLRPLGDRLEPRVEFPDRLVAEVEEIRVEERQVVVGLVSACHVPAYQPAVALRVIFVLDAQVAAQVA